MAAEGEFYKKLNASELSAIISKESLSSNDHDTGFFSGTSEGEDNASVDYSNRLETKSPTDTSEDSIEIKVIPINLQQRHKRKGTEPSKIINEKDIGPNRKRIRYTINNDIQDEIKTECNSNQSWDEITNNSPLFDPSQVLDRHPGVTTFHRNIFDSSTQNEPLALIVKKPTTIDTETNSFQIIQNGSSYSNANNSNHNNEHLTTTITTVPNINNSSIEASEKNFKNKQRNYKNMSRERRIEANARERTRVHTISAAYDTLRKAIPSYAHRQKLSKLSVLRIASSYILTLSRMVGRDYSECQDAPSISECFDIITKTIQNEGKLRKRKDD